MRFDDLDVAVVARLGDLELMASLHGLVARDRALTARLLLHLGEVDARGLYRDQAFPSMFEYAVEALHMSPDEAYVRLRAAKLAREFPLVLEMLGRNELHLSAIKLLAPHLTQANHVEVLAQAKSKSKRAVEMIVAELAPKPDVPSSMRKLPAPGPAVRATLPAIETVAAVLPLRDSSSNVQGETVPPLPPPFKLDAVVRREPGAQLTTPLSRGRYKVQFTATQTLHDKLERLKDLMRHQVPDGNLSAIVERAVDLLIEQRMTKRFAQAKQNTRASETAATASEPPQHAGRYVSRAPARAEGRSERASHHPPRAPLHTEEETQPTTRHVPRTSVYAAEGSQPEMRYVPHVSVHAEEESSQAAPREVPHTEAPRQLASRYVPRAVIREVHARDGGRCTFVSSDGRRCSARGFLELHHEEPYARGGASKAQNLKLMCRAHNALLAERDFGRHFMRAKLNLAPQRRNNAAQRGLGPELSQP